MDKIRRNLLKSVLAISAVMMVMYGIYYGFQQYQLSKKVVEHVPAADSVYEVSFSMGPNSLKSSNAEGISKMLDSLSTAKATNKGVYHDANALYITFKFYDENGEYDSFSYYLITDGKKHYIDIDYYPYYPGNSSDTLWRVDDEFYDLAISVAREALEASQQEENVIDAVPAAE